MAFEPRLFALIVTLCMSATDVLAAPSSSERETARSLMLEGDRLRTSGDPAAALACYQSAHAIMRVPTTGLALAETQAQLWQLVEARSTAMEVMNLTVVAGEPEVYVTARKSAAALAAALEPRVPTLKTSITPAAAPYSVQIDAVMLPSAARAAPFKTNPGVHRVRIEAPGYVTQEREVQLREGVTELLSFSLLAAAPPVQHEPVTPHGVPLSAAQPSDRRASAGRVRGIVGLSVGALGLAAGITGGVLSWFATKHEERMCEADGLCAASRASALSRANTLSNVANLSLPVGVLGIAYGLYELLSLPDATPPPARGGLQLTLTSQGAVLRGAW